MKFKTTATVILIATSLSVFGQKVKYKDLFPMLNAKNWDQGGPQLKAFISDPDNVKDKGYPNANLQMALMLEERFFALDLASDSVAGYNAGDSAVYFFGNAKQLIDEKELKKNDGYYQAFFRRDLRTGDFGIKESDVHLDIEKKVEAIENRMKKSRELDQKVRSVEKTNKGLEEGYQKLSGRYSNDYNRLLLSADQEDQSVLQQMKMDGLKAKNLAGEVKKLASELGTTKFSGDIVLKEIKVFGSDGLNPPSLASGIIEMWDYEGWAITTTSEINGSIGILKSMALNYSKTIREKKSLIKKSQDAEVDTLSQELVDLFEKYDPESVAKKLILTEASEARIMRLVDYSINKVLLDSSQVGAQLITYQTVLAEAQRMQPVVESITPDDLSAAKITYPDYIKSFFQKYGTAGSYVTEMKTWAKRQKNWAATAAEFWEEKNRWGVVPVEGESQKRIPLFVQEAPESEFFTLGMPVNTNQEVIVYGADLSAKKGYVYSFDEARSSRWALEFKLPGEANFQLSADTVPAAKGSTSFYLLNAAAQENNLAIASFSSAGALNWSVVVTAPKVPVDYKFDDITQELTILLYPEEELPLDNGELGYMVVDRTGNAR